MQHTLARTVVAALAATVLSACGAGASPSDDPAADGPTIEVRGAWVRATSGTEDPTMTAAFMVIYNHGDTDVDLVSAETDAAATAELHEMASVDGQMVMQRVDGGITITAGRGKDLAPGGYHVMLMGVDRELAPGDEVPLTLRFSDGSVQRLRAPVKAYTEEKGHYHAPGTAPHTHGTAPAGGADGMAGMKR